MQYGYYGAHACAMHRDGGLSCWGTNEYGELGDGTSDTRLSPVRVSMSPEALIHAPLPDESRLLRYHLEVFVTEYEEEVPWLREAWDFIREQTSFTYDICAPAETCLESSGRVDVVCENPNGDFACRATRMRLHGQTPEDFGHQLAHVYDKTTALTPNKAWGAVQLYFSNTYPDCYTVMGLGAGSEILADTMTYLFVPDPFLDYFVQVSWMLDRRGDFDRPDCPELSSRPSAEAVQVVRSGLAGLVPDWYSSNITNGTELLEALRRAPNVFILANLSDEFGGLCTTDWLTYPLDPARLPPSGSNPFRDGGC